MNEVGRISLRGVTIPVPEAPLRVPNLDFERGRHYLIEAESGTGKSSLCSFIYGQRRDYEGVISFDERNIRSLSIAEWSTVRCHNIALLPQDMRIFPELTALENVEIKNRLTQHLSVQRIAQLFEALGIGDKLNRPARQLSIGQQQRVAIIRTLAQPADFILLDEPVSHLDERNNRLVAEIILEHARAMGAAIVFTSVGNPLLLDTEYQTIKLAKQ